MTRNTMARKNATCAQEHLGHLWLKPHRYFGLETLGTLKVNAVAP